MKKLLFLFVSLAILTSACSVASSPTLPPLKSVETLDLQRYLGTWFAAARIPNRFEADCLQSKAEYALKDENSLTVTNSCPTKDGGVASVQGRAWVLDQTSAKLEVGFFSILGWYPPFARGDYWVVGLGPLNDQGLYSYALVGEPSRRYGWILSRDERLKDEYLSQALGMFEQQGYSRENFQMLQR